MARLIRQPHPAALAVSLPLGGLLLLAPGAPAKAHPGLLYGMNIAGVSSWTVDMARQAGFSHVKVSIKWGQLQSGPGRMNWQAYGENDLDNVLRHLRPLGMKMILRIDGGPPWKGSDAHRAHPDEVYWLYQQVAAYGLDLITAFEVLNEPNLRSEWRAKPDPAAYTRYLKAAYAGVKDFNPSTMVLGGGLAAATGSSSEAMDDFEFIRGMYAAGAKGAMDGLSIHNYGGNSEPERDPFQCGEMCFRRAERYRDLLLELGDSTTPLWATEFGWPIDGGRDIGSFNWMKVGAETQADYLVRAYRYAHQNWDWMRGMILFNLDHSTAPWHGPDSSLHWFSILNPDHSPRPAYEALRNMPKP
jgi:hypothetical protein